LSDLRGVARLAVDATLGLADVVEAMHGGIARPWALRAPPERTRGITGIVYGSIRLTTRLVGAGLDAALAVLPPATREDPPTSRRDAVVAALEGVVGDHLAATGNPLATPLHLRHDGRALELTPAGLAAALPAASGRVAVMVHGLCRSDRQWLRDGHDHGAALARDLGFTVVHVRYNSGLHVSINGHALAERLETALAAWPVPVDDLVIVGHSMGGLVARSACHYAALSGAAWPALLRRLVFLGTPHHGAPLERGGRWLHAAIGAAPYTRPLARLGGLRSAGITDLRHGSLLDEDWRGRNRFAGGGSPGAVPLPAGVACFAVGATLARRPEARHARLLGDGLVPLDSALGRHRDAGRSLALPVERQWVGCGMGHLDLLGRREVYETIRNWLGDGAAGAGAAGAPVDTAP
jgi:hypothetical protein